MAFSIKSATEVAPTNVMTTLNGITVGVQSSPYQAGDIATFGAMPRVFEIHADVNGREVSYYVIQADSVTRNGVPVPPLNPTEGHRIALSAFCSKDARVLDVNNQVTHIDGRYSAGTAGNMVYQGLQNQTVTFNVVTYVVETARGREQRRLTAWK